MNNEPIFTDSRGRAIKPPAERKKKSEWNGARAFVAIMMIALIPLLAFGATTQLDLTIGVKGLLGGANGGLNANAASFTGVLREASGTSTASELSGDAATSGSNAVTVTKVNGTSIPTNSAADQVVVTTASATGAYKTVPDCPTGALQYTQSTHAFSCGTVLTGSFADLETPSGTVNGSNTAFTLAHTPSPAGSLLCLENGLGQEAGGNDYTLSTATITYGTAPPTGTKLRCSYRY